MLIVLKFIGQYWNKMQKPLLQNVLAALLVTASYAAVAQLIHSFLQAGEKSIVGHLFWVSLI